MFVKGLDAYFNDQPYRAIVLFRDSMAQPSTGALREATLYALGQSFAAIHLYEKAEDSLGALLLEFPRGRYAPVAIRELARIFFNLHEYSAVVNLEQSYRGTLPEGAIPVEFWYLLGQSNYMIGRKSEARGPLLKVGPGTPFYPFARFTLGQAEFGLGRADAALSALSEVASHSASPALLRERAMRVAGMILYQQKRFRESVKVYEGIGESSALYGASRVDMALAAEAGGDLDAAREAFIDAMNRSADDFIRTEARVAVGKFLNRKQKAAAAKTLFEQALTDLKTREAKLRESVEVDDEFRQTFAELVTFARQSGGNPRLERMGEDLQMLKVTLASTLGVPYDRGPLPAYHKLSPKTYLFPLLQQRFHNPQIIETFVELAVEIEDLKKQIADLEKEIRGQRPIWDAATPLRATQVPENVRSSLQQMVWLLFGNFDLLTRFYDALALNEKVEVRAAAGQKQRALGSTVEALRLILFGGREIPSKTALLEMMVAARDKIASGKIKGMLAQQVRDGFLQEWQSDKDSFTFVVDNLELKHRQMLSALEGVPLRSRNVNLPVLSTMTEWLTALQQLDSKYRYIEFERDERPWHLVGRNTEVTAVLARAGEELDQLNERTILVLRKVALELVNKEQFKHSFVVAQAEEGIADALFQERATR